MLIRFGVPRMISGQELTRSSAAIRSSSSVFSKHQREEAAEHVTTDGLVQLVEDRPGGQQMLAVSKCSLHRPRYRRAEHGLKRIEIGVGAQHEDAVELLLGPRAPVINIVSSAAAWLPSNRLRLYMSFWEHYGRTKQLIFPDTAKFFSQPNYPGLYAKRFQVWCDFSLGSASFGPSPDRTARWQAGCKNCRTLIDETVKIRLLRQTASQIRG